jgi:NADH-quinone oxidoreductase subunit N
MAGAGKGNYVFITIAALNMIISLYYYLKIVKAMFMDANERPLEKLSVTALPKLAMLICLTGIVAIGFIPQIYNYIYSLSFGF